MDAKQQQLEKEKSERELDKSAAKLRMLEARTEQRRIFGAAPEVVSLQGVHGRMRELLRSLKDADETAFDDALDEMKRGIGAFSRNLDTAADRLDRLDDANDRWLELEADRFGGAYELFQAWLGEESVADRESAAQLRADVRSAWEDVSKKRNALKAAALEKREQARATMQDSLAAMREKLATAAAHFHKPRQPETRT